MSVRRLEIRDGWLALGLALTYTTVLGLTHGSLALSRDESFYIEHAQIIATWLRRLLADPMHAITPPVLAAGWPGVVADHPPLMKYLFAASLMSYESARPSIAQTLAMRIPTMAIAGLLIGLMYIWGAQYRSRLAGFCAAILFGLLPRVFYHSHLICLDVPITFFSTVALYCYWRSLQARRWSIAYGVTLGLALLTKHNAWLLPFVLLVHWFLAHRHEPPWWLFSTMLITPIVVYVGWPWLWYDSWPHLLAYVNYHLQHDYYNMAYLGGNFFRPPFPIGYPWLMTLWTVPAVTLLLAIGGIALLGGSLIASRSIWVRKKYSTEVLWLGACLAPIVLISLPFTPIFGGTKHWFPAYPFMCLFAGATLSCLCGWLKLRTRIVVLGLLFCAPLIETIHSHGFGLSFYTPLAGGVPGAASKGMNRQFWGFTTGHLATYINAHIPRLGRLWLCDTTWGAWLALQRDGIARADIQATAAIADAHMGLVHHELHFAEVDFQFWQAYGHVKPLTVLLYDGVPLISVYEKH